MRRSHFEMSKPFSDPEAQHGKPVYLGGKRSSFDFSKWMVRMFAVIGLIYVFQRGVAFYLDERPDHFSSLAHSRPGQNLSTHPIEDVLTHTVHNDGATTDLVTKAIVVASQTKDHTDWIQENFPDWQINIYVVDDPEAQYTVLKQAGHEGSVFLTYIINHYYNLPDVMVFNHASRYQWHNEDPMFDGVPPIRNLRLEHVLEEGYASLRCTWKPGCPNNAQLIPGHKDGIFDIEGGLAQIYQDWFPERVVPNVTGAPCCAQFAVSRDQVLLRPITAYEQMRHWLWTTNKKPEVSGRMMEYSWHLIFSKPDIYCIDAATCFCKKFGLCNLNCPDRTSCDGRFYLLPWWIKLPPAWPFQTEDLPFGVKPFGWWHEYYPEENFGLDWMDPAVWQTDNQTDTATAASAINAPKPTEATVADAEEFKHAEEKAKLEDIEEFRDELKDVETPTGEPKTVAEIVDDIKAKGNEASMNATAP